MTLVPIPERSMVLEMTERTVTFRPPRARKPVIRTTGGVLLLRALGR